MAFPVLLDACVLAPMPLADFLLRLADQGIYRPLWSEDILAETRRTMIKRLNVAPELADKRLNTMRDHFVDAEVTGYQDLIGVMRNDKKDRHVLAAAVREHAEVIVTSNDKHFPRKAVDPYHIEVRHPDDFLLDQIDLYEDATLSAILGMVADYGNPPFTAHQILDALGTQVPNFAAEARRLIPPPTVGLPRRTT
ncbi:PIN domain-containing protein [Mycobacterium gastri]|uniref:DNA-binding protein n=1 Tax=Mycobacterium gastri TaxID=1777 RepID=A0A1X1USY7_MYCGS|nr:PIN domain-containing protein [Mycobacterium gastri]ETW23197.1 DNA-binding protein [Mycobacterium gastri 'Wayne']ORV59964.1 DNA-binding protein [Mycobacterium gastri]